jgi:hypothetical protein
VEATTSCEAARSGWAPGDVATDEETAGDEDAVAEDETVATEDGAAEDGASATTR